MFREDADISDTAREVLEGEGITIHLQARVKRLAQEAEQKIDVFFEQEGETKQVRGTHLLLAVGRIPNSDRLNLEAAGVEVNEHGYIVVNDVMQTNVPHIFAVGDITGEGAFTHTSVNDGEIFWDFYSGDDDRTLGQRISTYAVFIDPPLGRVGMSEKEARASGHNALMATRPMRTINRAKEKDETAGLVKILVDADTKEILGAAILGVGGDEVVHSILDVMYAKKPYTLIERAVHIHPTVSELIPTMLGSLKPLE